MCRVTEDTQTSPMHFKRSHKLNLPAQIKNKIIMNLISRMFTKSTCKGEWQQTLFAISLSRITQDLTISTGEVASDLIKKSTKILTIWRSKPSIGRCIARRSPKPNQDAKCSAKDNRSPGNEYRNKKGYEEKDQSRCYASHHGRSQGREKIQDASIGSTKQNDGNIRCYSLSRANGGRSW